MSRAPGLAFILWPGRTDRARSLLSLLSSTTGPRWSRRARRVC